MKLALGGDSTAGPWQRTGAVGEKSPTHLDDALGGVPPPGWKAGSPWSLDCCDEKGREGPLPTFGLQCCVSSVVPGYNSNVNISVFVVIVTEPFSQNIKSFLT